MERIEPEGDMKRRHLPHVSNFLSCVHLLGKSRQSSDTRTREFDFAKSERAIYESLCAGPTTPQAGALKSRVTAPMHGSPMDQGV